MIKRSWVRRYDERWFRGKIPRITRWRRATVKAARHRLAGAPKQ